MNMIEAGCRALAIHDGTDPDGETIIADRPQRWMLLVEDVCAVLEGIREEKALEDACRKAADPASGDVCWVGVSVHRAADIVDSVIGAALSKSNLPGPIPRRHGVSE